MRAVVLAGPGQISVEQVPDPVPGPGDVVLSVGGCGICGTDLHLVDGDIGRENLPLIPGHEPWGVVVAVGAAVSEVRVGDAAAVDPSLHCGRCEPCRRGQGNMCQRWGAIGATVAGAWADFVKVPSANVYSLSDAFPLQAAPLLEPVACALRGLERMAPTPDQRVIVFGGGTIGILLSILLDLRGVGPVTIVDINPVRRALAAELTGCDVRSPQETVGERAPWVIEATGSAAGFSQALDSVGRAGPLLVSPYRIYTDELSIVGSMAILRSFPAAVDAVSRHAERLAPLITHKFELTDIQAALQTVRSGNSVKTLLVPR
jgi:2-desacetyl-2-hydroxyethyl bacteriochlorophyllide A dehydrogenase